MLKWIEHATGEYWRVLHDRRRATLLRLRGARLGFHARVGASCVIKRPWCLTIGERSHLELRVHIKATGDDADIHIGREVFVGFNSEFDVSDKLWIGDHVLIAPNCFITDHNHGHAAGQLIATQDCNCSSVRLEDDVWLGAHVVVLPGVTIGRGAVVAAGAVVNRDVEPMSIVAGVPARKIGART